MAKELENKKQFLSTAAKVLKWGGLANQEILYISCGTGRKYIRTFLQLFPKIRKVFYSDLMDTANIENIPRKTELLSADIQEISKLSTYKDYFSHIVSIDCFNWVKDPKNGFSTIYHLLKTGGTAAILMSINSPFEDCFKDLLENSDWKKFEWSQETTFPLFPVRLSTKEYIELIKGIGFNVVHCEEYCRTFEFQSLMDFYEKCTGFMSPLLVYIPKEKHPMFENDFLDNFKRLHGFSFRGKPRMKSKTLSIFIRKPAPPPPTPPSPPSEATPSCSSYQFSNFGGRF